MLTVTQGSNHQNLSDLEIAQAYSLSGKSWHSLTAEETAQAIHHQRVTGLLHPPIRTTPARGHGDFTVGQVTISADA
jgi:hypothetical protein